MSRNIKFQIVIALMLGAFMCLAVGLGFLGNVEHQQVYVIIALIIGAGAYGLMIHISHIDNDRMGYIQYLNHELIAGGYTIGDAIASRCLEHGFSPKMITFMKEGLHREYLKTGELFPEWFQAPLDVDRIPLCDESHITAV